MERVEVNLGDVYAEVTLTLDTGAYADLDLLADTQEIADVLEAGGTAIWQSLVVLDKSDQGQALDVLLLRTNVTMGTENAEISVSDANADEIVGVAEVGASDYIDLAGSQLAQIANIGVVFKADDAATSMWCAAVSRGTGTYAATGITLKFGFLVVNNPDKG